MHIDITVDFDIVWELADWWHFSGKYYQSASGILDISKCRTYHNPTFDVKPVNVHKHPQIFFFVDP